MYRVLVPQEASAQIPQGAAVLELRRGQGFVYHEPGVLFGECCARALRHGRPVALSEDMTHVANFDEYEGEVRLMAGRVQELERWISSRVYRNHLEARDNRRERRARARNLALQGRTAEAYRLDRRLGF